MREARRDDVAVLVTLMAEFYAEAGYVLDRLEANQSFATLLAEPRLGHVWLVEAGDEPAGYLVVTYVFAMEHGGFTAIVDDFFVKPSWRGRGLGTAALAHVRRECVARGMRAMRVEVGHDNAPAQAVYRRNGLAAVDHHLMAVTFGKPASGDAGVA